MRLRRRRRTRRPSARRDSSHVSGTVVLFCRQFTHSAVSGTSPALHPHHTSHKHHTSPLPRPLTAEIVCIAVATGNHCRASTQPPLPLQTLCALRHLHLPMCRIHTTFAREAQTAHPLPVTTTSHFPRAVFCNCGNVFSSCVCQWIHMHKACV
jgi:hypothetical protein